MSKSANGMLATLRSSGCVVSLVDGEIDIDGPDNVLTDAVVYWLRASRTELLRELAIESRPLCSPHNNPSNYIDTPDPHRRGWLRTTCRQCGKFVGYRPEVAR